MTPERETPEEMEIAFEQDAAHAERDRMKVEREHTRGRSQKLRALAREARDRIPPADGTERG